MSGNTRDVLSSDKKKAKSEAVPKTIEKLQMELKQTVDSLKCLEVVTASSRGGDLRVLCRCHSNENWLQILYKFLEQSRDREWYSFIGKKYFLWEGRMTAAWVIIIQADELDKAVQDVRKMLLAINAEIQNIPAPRQPKKASYTVPLPSGSGFERSLQERTGAPGSRSAGDRSVRTVSITGRS